MHVRVITTSRLAVKERKDGGGEGKEMDNRMHASEPDRNTEKAVN